jgi:hypothetical protein
MNQSPHSGRLSGRDTVGVLLFIVGCLLSTFRLIYTSPNPAHLRMDDIALRSEQRFTALRTQLPTRGVVGYVGQSDNRGTEDYYLAQYALAPLLLEHSPNHPLVIASFPDAPPVLPQNLELVRDFGNGVLLLSNKDAR